MKYTFIAENGKQKTVEIEDAWITKQCRLLGISKREAINMWLSDEGYISDETVAELTAKAKQNKVGAKGAATKPRKKPERKPDYIKREIINYLRDVLDQPEDSMRDTNDHVITPQNVEITNIERMIAFSLGDDNYEITLTKKRKPKN